LLQEIVKDKHIAFDKTTNNFRFSAAVAGFGLILRQSEFKGTANYDNIMALAKNAYGNDDEGYRAEFVRLVKTARDLDKKEVGMKE
jgi:Ca-activated chloride channel homolog